MSDNLSTETIAEAELQYARVKISIDDLIGHTAVLRQDIPEAVTPFSADESIQEWMMALGQQDAIMLILGLVTYIFDSSSPDQHEQWANEHVCSNQKEADDPGRSGSDN